MHSVDNQAGDEQRAPTSSRWVDEDRLRHYGNANAM